MSIELLIVVVFLVLALVGQWYWRSSNFLEIIRRIFWISVFVMVGVAGYFSLEQYRLWKSNSVGKYLLPPYQGWSYFIFYAGVHFFGPFVISFCAAFLLWIAMRRFNKRYEERFFYEEDYWLAALSIFVMGHPGWLIYLIVLLLIYLLIHAGVRFLWRECEEIRISFCYLWLPAAIFVILVETLYLKNLPWWYQLLL